MMENITETPVSATPAPASVVSTPQPSVLTEVTPSVVASAQNGGKNHNMLFIIIGVLFIAFIGGIFYYLQMGKTYVSPPTVVKTVVAPTVIPTMQPTATPVPDTSDTSIDSDTQSVDTSIQQLSTDAQGVDTGLNDKAINVN